MADNKPGKSPDDLILLEMLYKSEQNPVYVWEAIANAQLFSISLPEWVLDYLAQASINIMALTESPPTRIGPALTIALGFKDEDAPYNPFGNAQKIANGLRLAVEVQILIRNGDKEYIAIEETAKAQETSKGTVRRAYEDWQERFKRHYAMFDEEE